VAAFALAAALILGTAGCGGGDGEGISLPTAVPSIDLPERTAAPEETATEETDTEPEETSEQTRTTTAEETGEPAETAEPTRTQGTGAALPTVTRKTSSATTAPVERTPEETETEAPAETTAPAEATQSSEAVPVAESADTGSFLPWLLLFLAIGAVIAIVLFSRSRRESQWDAEGSGLAAETRSVIGVRLPPVLTATTAGERGLTWPPVRDDLRDLSARWGLLSQHAPDGDRQASASQIALLLRDLVPAIDAENEALAAGRDWSMLRPQVQAVLDSLAAVMRPRQPMPARPQPPQPPTEPYYA
jgi:hypothetical protein